MNIHPSLCSLFLWFLGGILSQGLSAEPTLDARFVANAETASVEGNKALWHNPAGLGFMGGHETSLLYLYEWNNLGNRHFGGANAAVNYWNSLTLALGIRTKLAFSRPARENLGSELMGIFGTAFNPTPYTSFGVSVMRAQ